MNVLKNYLRLTKDEEIKNVISNSNIIEEIIFEKILQNENKAELFNFAYNIYDLHIIIDRNIWYDSFINYSIIENIFSYDNAQLQMDKISAACLIIEDEL